MNIQTVTYNDITFLDVHSPQELEVKHLLKEYNFNALDLDDYIARNQTPKIEEYKDYTLVILDFPYFDPLQGAEKQEQEQAQNGKSQIPKVSIPQLNLPLLLRNVKKRRIKTGHVNFFIGQQYLVVLHDDKTPQIDDIFTQCQKALKYREEYMGRGPVFLFYQLIDKLVDSSLQTAREISQVIDYIDKQLIENSAATIVEDISVTRRNIVVFHTMIKAAIGIFGHIEKGMYKKLSDGMVNYWRNTLDHLRKTIDRLEDNRELIEGISISHESLLTARTNEIVKVLTMFTAILLPLTLLASIYGMNIVGLPLAESPQALLVIGEVMAVMAVGMIVAFKLKNWL